MHGPAQASKGLGRGVMYKFSGETLDEAGARREAPPFAIVASMQMDLSVGR